MPKSYIRGKPAKAACSLIDHLSAAGVVAAVGYDGGNQFPRKIAELIVVVNAGNTEAIPSEWMGIPVRWELNRAKD